MADEKDDYLSFFKPKPLFIEDNDLWITVKPPKSKRKLSDNVSGQSGDEDDCGQESCIIDDNGKFTSDDYILNKNDFNKWSINQIITKEKLQFYKLNRNNSKQFNENTFFWKFVKQKCKELKKDNCYPALIKASTQRVNKLIKTEYNLVKSMTFDEIASIYIYTTDLLYYQLNKSLRNGKNSWSPFAIVLISALNKLPLTWDTLYRGTSCVKVHNMVVNKYKIGAILKRDSFYSTSTDLSIAKKFAGSTGKGTIFVMENTFHGREIGKFSQFEKEKEILFSLSSNFIITKIEQKEKHLYVRCRELPFPWNLKTILWVNDNLTACKNNKLFIERLERNGVMVIPRISTNETIEFWEFCKNAIDMNNFKQFRVITNMGRNEYLNEKKIYEKKAGIKLIKELRNKGYTNNICIYDKNKKVKVLQKYKNNNIFIASELKDIEQWISPSFINVNEFEEKQSVTNPVHLYDINYEKKLVDELLNIVFNFDESKWIIDVSDAKQDIYTHHKMISGSHYCIRGVSKFECENIMNFYHNALSAGKHQKILGWKDKDNYTNMREIDDDHCFMYHKPSIDGLLSYILTPRDFCVIRARFKLTDHIVNHEKVDICGSLSYSVTAKHPWYIEENKNCIRTNIHYSSFLLVHCKSQLVQSKSKKLYFISNNDVKGSMPKWFLEKAISNKYVNEEINAYENIKQFGESWDNKMRTLQYDC